MTVNPPSPSRAGSLPLIADDLALDFANTESGRGFPSHENHFREAGNVVAWLRHANALRVEEKVAVVNAASPEIVTSSLPLGSV